MRLYCLYSVYGGVYGGLSAVNPLFWAQCQQRAEPIFIRQCLRNSPAFAIHAIYGVMCSIKIFYTTLTRIQQKQFHMYYRNRKSTFHSLSLLRFGLTYSWSSNLNASSSLMSSPNWNSTSGNTSTRSCATCVIHLWNMLMDWKGYTQGFHSAENHLFCHIILEIFFQTPNLKSGFSKDRNAVVASSLKHSKTLYPSKQGFSIKIIINKFKLSTPVQRGDNVWTKRVI